MRILAPLLLTSVVALGQPCALPSFVPPRVITGVPAGRYVDVDGDGKIDVVAQRPDGTAVWYRGLGGATFESGGGIPLRAGGTLVASGDLNGDGRLDLVAQRVAASTVSVLLGDGRGGFAEGPDVAGITGTILVGDVDGDGVAEVVGSGRDGQGKKTVVVVKGTSLGLVRGSRADEETAYPILLADVDGDGRIDLVIARYGTNSGSMWFVRGQDGLFAGDAIAIGTGTRAVSTDLDGDGRPDLVTVNGRATQTPLKQLRVYLGTGTGAPRDAGGFDVGPYGFVYDYLQVADLNGDGVPDALAAGTTGLYLYTGDGKGGFGPSIVVAEGGAGLVPADVTGDGRPDLLGQTSDGALTVRENTCGGGQAASDLVVPVLVSAAGANGASYASELSLVNHGDAAASLSVRRADDGSSSVAAAVLAGGRQARSQDVLGFGIVGLPYAPPPSGSSLRIHATGLSTAEDVGGVVRVVSTVKGSPDRGGVAFPVVRYGETFGSAAIVGWLAETVTDRSNLALLNVEEAGDVTLRVTVVSTDPEHPGSAALPDVTLGPGVFRQLDRVLTLAGLGATSGFARIERVAGTGRFYAYGVVNDNGTSDGSFVAAQAVGALSGETTLVVPAVVEAGAFVSELVMTNTAAVSRKLRLEYVADAIATADHTARLTLDLGPGRNVDFERFLDVLRTLGLPGLGRAGPIFSGALFVTVEEGDAEGLFVGARTSSLTSRGRYGVFTPAVPLSRCATSFAWLHGLKQDEVDRTNVALVNAGSEADVFRIEIFDGTTGLLAATVSDVRVEPRGWRQLGRILADRAPGVRNAYAKVARVSGGAPFVAYAVINDGEGPGQGTGDGSYVPMSRALP